MLGACRDGDPGGKQGAESCGLLEMINLGETGGVQDAGVVFWVCFPGDGVWGVSGWQPSLLLLPVQPCIPLAWSLLVPPGLAHVPLQSPSCLFGAAVLRGCLCLAPAISTLRAAEVGTTQKHLSPRDNL